MHFWAYDELKSTKSFFKLLLLICFVCILLRGDIFLHFAVHLTKRGKRENLYPSSGNRNRWEKLQSADFGNKHEGRVHRWQDIFWQKAFFGETLICQMHLIKCFWRGGGGKVLETLGESKQIFFLGESSAVVENLENIFFLLSFVLPKRADMNFI